MVLWLFILDPKHRPNKSSEIEVNCKLQRIERRLKKLAGLRPRNILTPFKLNNGRFSPLTDL